MTEDQLSSHVKDESLELRDINRKLDSVTDFIAEEKGKEVERENLSNQQRRDNPK